MYQWAEISGYVFAVINYFDTAVMHARIAN